MNTFRRLVITILLAGAGTAVASVLLVTQVKVLFTAGSAGAVGELSLGPLATRSVIYARDGSALQLLHAEENRKPVSLDKVPPHVVRAVLDAEDDRFYDHGPLDLRGLARALVVNVQEGAVSEGGSTITQQLVKTALLSSRQNAKRKIQEAALAVRLESQMSKSEILERYLNTVYFGNGAYGIQAAAERYFGVDADRLTMGQGVLLAGLIRNPVGAEPFAFPTAARERRDVIIDRMVLLKHLGRQEADAVKAEALPVGPAGAPVESGDYFPEYVKNQLLADPRLGSTEAERFQAVFKGGLQIYTTLDPRMQHIAEEKVTTILPDTKGEFNAALVSIDPTTGAVRALVGGNDFDRTKFNLVTDGRGRQTGSSFKVFTLIAALEQGLIPTDTILGAAPCTVPNPGGVPDPWTPDNVEGEAPGVLSLTDATVHSVNCAFARLVKLVGPEKVAEVAHRMGVTNHLNPYLAITLGVEGVTPLQMAAAYATLAADGERHRPYFIEKVNDREGHLIFQADTKGERVISAQNARVATQVLTQVVQRGTGRAAAVRGWTVAGKTGTTDNNGDAWFVGYTPKLATAVWMGSPGEVKPMFNVGGIRVFGGTYPARIWGAYTGEALAGVPVARFPEPEKGFSRAGKFLLLPGERAVVTFEPTPANTVPEAGVPTNSIPDITLPDTRFRPRDIAPTIPTVPRTTRTSRPPRPRDRPVPSLPT